MTLLLTNHAFPGHPIRSEVVTLTLKGKGKPSSVSIERIDDDHCNAKRAWIDLGSPDYPSPAQVATMKDASRLVSQPIEVVTHEVDFELNLSMPEHSVAAVHVQYRTPSA